MTISIGYFHSSIRLLDTAKDGGSIYIPEINYDQVFFLSPLNELINISIKCCWIRLIDEDRYELSDRGHEIVSRISYEDKLRDVLRDYIVSYRPTWGKALYTGRHEFCRYVSANVLECFRMATLLEVYPDMSVVFWWDELSMLFRGIKSLELLEIGRRGERLTIEYETTRTGMRPIWQSIESNFSGYDVLSIASIEDPSRLQIEVKTSSRSISQATFMISRNEWQHAICAGLFRFYLWSVTSILKLAVLDVSDIEPHIPVNKGNGKWSVVEIPMRAFHKQFIVV